MRMDDMAHKNPCVCTIGPNDEIIDYDCALGPVDMVNHPPHYTSHVSGVECIDIARHLSGDWFNVFKYVFRADLKNGFQDLEKAEFYAKDGLKHNIPVHAPSWNPDAKGLLAQVIAAEPDWRRAAFYIAISLGQALRALHCVREIMKSMS